MSNKNRKAQVSDAVMWTAATLIIIVILIIFIYASAILGKARSVANVGGKFFSNYDRTQDLLMDKSLSVYFLTKEDSGLYNKLKSMDYLIDLDDRIKEIKYALDNGKKKE